jgi:hypothetical protein
MKETPQNDQGTDFETVAELEAILKERTRNA